MIPVSSSSSSSNIPDVSQIVNNYINQACREYFSGHDLDRHFQRLCERFPLMNETDIPQQLFYSCFRSCPEDITQIFPEIPYGKEYELQFLPQETRLNLLQVIIAEQIRSINNSEALQAKRDKIQEIRKMTHDSQLNSFLVDYQTAISIRQMEIQKQVAKKVEVFSHKSASSAFRPRKKILPGTPIYRTQVRPGGDGASSSRMAHTFTSDAFEQPRQRICEMPPYLSTQRTEHGFRYDVPHDHSCLFWSFLAAFIQQLEDEGAFHSLFVRIFGEDEMRERILKLALHSYDGSIESLQTFPILTSFVLKIRHFVVETMRRNNAAEKLEVTPSMLHTIDPSFPFLPYSEATAELYQKEELTDFMVRFSSLQASLKDQQKAFLQACKEHYLEKVERRFLIDLYPNHGGLVTTSMIQQYDPTFCETEESYVRRVVEFEKTSSKENALQQALKERYLQTSGKEHLTMQALRGVDENFPVQPYSSETADLYNKPSLRCFMERFQELTCTATSEEEKMKAFERACLEHYLVYCRKIATPPFVLNDIDPSFPQSSLEESPGAYQAKHLQGFMTRYEELKKTMSEDGAFNLACFECYLEKMDKYGVWGGETEIRSFSEAVGIPIQVTWLGQYSRKQVYGGWFPGKRLQLLHEIDHYNFCTQEPLNFSREGRRLHLIHEMGRLIDQIEPPPSSAHLSQLMMERILSIALAEANLEMTRVLNHGQLFVASFPLVFLKKLVEREETHLVPTLAQIIEKSGFQISERYSGDVSQFRPTTEKLIEMIPAEKRKEYALECVRALLLSLVETGYSQDLQEMALSLERMSIKNENAKAFVMKIITLCKTSPQVMEVATKIAQDDLAILKSISHYTLVVQYLYDFAFSGSLRDNDLATFKALIMMLSANRGDDDELGLELTLKLSDVLKKGLVPVQSAFEALVSDAVTRKDWFVLEQVAHALSTIIKESPLEAKFTLAGFLKTVRDEVLDKYPVTEGGMAVAKLLQKAQVTPDLGAILHPNTAIATILDRAFLKVGGSEEEYPSFKEALAALPKEVQVDLSALEDCCTTFVQKLESTDSIREVALHLCIDATMEQVQLFLDRLDPFLEKAKGDLRTFLLQLYFICGFATTSSHRKCASLERAVKFQALIYLLQNEQSDDDDTALDLLAKVVSLQPDVGSDESIAITIGQMLGERMRRKGVGILIDRIFDSSDPLRSELKVFFKRA